MVQVIKEIVQKMIIAEKLTNITPATVISINPIKIQVSQKLILWQDFIVVPENLTNHFTYMTSVEDSFNDIKDKSKYNERKKYIVYSGLKVGDKVILARAAGGQKYYVIDRIGEAE